MRLTLLDIPQGCRNYDYIMGTYHVSHVSAWRLLSGRVDHICPGYHVKAINIASDAWTELTQPMITRHIRNMVAYQIKKWRMRPSDFIDDIAQECCINAYYKSGIWMSMPWKKKKSYIATLCMRTTNDYLKKHVHYTDTCKNNNIETDKQLYPCINEW